MADFDPATYIAEKSEGTAPSVAAASGQPFDAASYIAEKSAASGPSSVAHGSGGGPFQNKESFLDHFFDFSTPAAGSMAGQEIGAAVPGFEEITVPVGGALGGAAGDYAAQKNRISKGEQPSLKAGELLSSAITGAIPGIGLAKGAAKGALALAAAKQGLGGLAADAIQSLIDRGKLPSATEAAIATALPSVGGAFAQKLQAEDPEVAAALSRNLAKNATADETLQLGKDAGYVVPPSSINPSKINRALESIGGKAAVGQLAAKRNQAVTDDLARQVLHASPDADLTSQLAQNVRRQAYQAGYAPVAASGTVTADQQYAKDLYDIYSNQRGVPRSFPGLADDQVKDLVAGAAQKKFDAGDALQAIQVMRDKASDAFASGQTGVGKAARGIASAMEDQLERHLQIQAVPSSSALALPGPQGTGTNAAQQQAAELLANFRRARQVMAQSHDVEDAIREGGGSVIANKLGSKLQAGRPLSGPLATVGRMANTFPSYMREGSRIPTPGVSAAGPFASLMAAAGLGTAGAAAHGAEGAIGGAAVGATLPMLRGAVRGIIFSKPYQELMANRPIRLDVAPPTIPLVLRQATQQAAKEPEAAESGN